MTIAVRRAVPADAARLSLLAGACFLASYAHALDGADIVDHCATHHGVDAYADCLGANRAAIWLAETIPGRAPVGYLMLDEPEIPIADPAPGDIEIVRLYALPGFQRAGIGRALIDSAIAEARNRNRTRLLLSVYHANENALGFYRRMGFTQCGTRDFRVGRSLFHDLVMALRI